MIDKNKWLIATNIYESGIIEVWFKGLTYALATSAFIYLYINNYQSALPFLIISYSFTGLQVIHGSRTPYEYLKNIYVYPQKNKIISGSVYTLLLYIRIQIIISPIQIIVISSETGKLPI